VLCGLVYNHVSVLRNALEVGQEADGYIARLDAR
jgi:hypothetical protein